MAAVKKNLFYNFLLSLSQILIPLVSIPFVSRVLDPEGIGRVGFIDTFTFYFVVLAEAGIMVYGIREVAAMRNNEQGLRRLLGELVSLHIRTSLLSMLLYAIGIALLWDKIGDSRLLWFSFAFLLMNAMACEWYYIGRERFKYIALRTLCIRLAGLACILLLLRQPDDYLLYYAIIAGSAILTHTVNLFQLFREQRFSLRSADWRKHLRKVGVTYLISLLYSVPLYLDHLVLRLMATASAVGYYSFSIRLVRIGTAVISDSFQVFMPRIASLHAADDNFAIQERLQQNLRLVLLLAIPLGIGIYLLAHEITAVLFGPDFSSIRLNLQVLALYPLFRAYSLFLSNPILIAMRKERVFLRNLAWSVGCYFLLAFAGAYYFADWGICWALVLADLLLVVLNASSIRRVFPFIGLMDFRTLGQALTTSLIFIPVVWCMRQLTPNSVLVLSGSVLLCFALYWLLLIYVWRNSQLKMILQGILYSITGKKRIN